MAIISYRNRFIFIKTRKTAGSSVEIALSRVCGPEDFITPIGIEAGPDEKLRLEEGGHPPANWRKPWWRYRTLKEVRHRLKRGVPAPVLGSHATAEQLRAHCGEHVWSTSFRFTVERNPWDKAVSRYWWMKYRHERDGGSEFPPISEFLARVARERPHWLSNWEHYTIDGRIAVDRVLFYERLAADLTALEGQLGLKRGVLALPVKHAKGGLREDPRHYSRVLSDADRDLVAAVCRREIEAFDYRFDETPGASVSASSAAR